MDQLYLEIFNSNKNSVEIPLETLIIYFLYKHCKETAFNLNFIKREKIKTESVFIITENFTDTNLPIIGSYCCMPLAIINNQTIISGLCSVARQLIKNLPDNNENKKLLGFREACLMACNESSVWTKFCEVDMLKTVKNLLQNPSQLGRDKKFVLPVDLTRFEYHLSQPVRIHNVYKVAQDYAKEQLKDSSNITTKIPKELLDLKHVYGEGPYMTLADIILLPLFDICLKVFGEKIFETYLPLTFNWYTNITKNINLISFEFQNINIPVNVDIIQENIAQQSLYISDPQRYKPRNRIFTKQPDIENALNIIKNMKIDVNLSKKPFGNEILFDWREIPVEANPQGGGLPQSRLNRKCDQLENLVKPVLKIAKDGQTIIDFCSGSGHLGILLAVNLPKCNIILLENKEKSLNRARDRVARLKLKNVTLIQCNLDYFIGDFDIGVSLHACGVATDLVIQHCLKRNAYFVSCPCCYGAVHVCHHISYPRSKIFQNSNLSLHDYLVLGHSADQTHDAKNAKTKQGIQCMNIIDTDRKLQAEEMGYEVILAKMVPENCSPKNNILVGIPKQK